MGKLRFTSLNMQEYLASQELSTADKKLLFSLRTRMVRNISCNFGKRTICPLCNGDEDLASDNENLPLDNQEHLLLCDKLKESSQELQENTDVIYEHIFENNVKILKPAIKLFQKAIRIRKTLLTPCAPSLSAA